MNEKLPLKATCRTSSMMAGTHVTSSRNVARITSLPMMYSIRVSGFDR